MDDEIVIEIAHFEPHHIKIKAIGYYPGDGITYDYIIPLYGFGDANRTALDTIYSQYNNKNN